MARPSIKKEEVKRDDRPLHIKYRPQDLTEVLGQEAVLASLASVLQQHTPHAYLLTGPSGTGKTTIARIIAKIVGAEEGILEIDAATNSGVDDMRQVTSMVQYQALGEQPTRFVIIDECFAPDTLVNTPTGLVTIKDIRVGDFVIGLKGVRQVRTVFRNKVALTRIIRLRLADGKSIICSRDHLFLTPEGWVPAGELDHVKSICKVRDRLPAHLPEMQRDFCESFARNYLLFGVSERTPSQYLSGMWEEVLVMVKALFTGVWQYCSGEEASSSSIGRSKTKCKRRGRTIKSRESGNLETGSQGLFREDEEKQPVADAWSFRENAGHKGGKGFSSYMEGEEGWKWPAHLRAAHPSAAFTLRTGVCNPYRAFSWGGRLALQLQGGFSIAQDQVGCRGGWERASKSASEGFRPEERSEAGQLRMASVTSIERGSEAIRDSGIQTDIFDGIEYAEFIDLEIEGHPSYAVEGLIVHNCHSLSKATWQSLLKSIEEPPDHVFWAFCTTEANKVPDTIRTRCHTYDLKGVQWEVIAEYLEQIAKLEGIVATDKCCGMIARKADGSVRQALQYLSMVDGLEDEKQIQQILETALENVEAIDLARFLVSSQGRTWAEATRKIDALAGVNPESVRLVIVNYITAILAKAKGDKEVVRLLRTLGAFSSPFYNASEKNAPLYLAVGSVIFGGEE